MTCYSMHTKQPFMKNLLLLPFSLDLCTKSLFSNPPNPDKFCLPVHSVFVLGNSCKKSIFRSASPSFNFLLNFKVHQDQQHLILPSFQPHAINPTT